LYHPGLYVTPFLSPFLDIGIAAVEIPRLTGNPFPLGCLLASSFAIRERTGTLTIADTVIGNKEPAAELAVLGQ
jgi:hypothetical protein